jgi:taurine dioxygenase
MNYQTIKAERRSPHLGAFIEAVDLTQPLADAAVAEIKAALQEFSVIFFRNQHITGEQHLEFAAHFGELDSPHPVFDKDERDARLTIIESKGRAHDDEHYWHTDVTYQEAPSFGSILAAKKIPESGGGHPVCEHVCRL